MSIDVRDDHLEIIRQILHKLVPQYRVIAFGSRVNGTANKTSDLDLCILTSEALPFNLLSALRDEFSLSNLPYKVDVLDWSSIDAAFQKIVLENNIEIQGL